MSDTPPEAPPDDLTEFERSFLDVIESRYSASTDQPEPEPVVPDEEEPVEGQPESPETTPEPETPDEGEAPDEEHGQSLPVFTLSGVEYTPDQLERAVVVHDWFQRLNNEQVQAVDALLSGQYRLQPASAPPQPQGVPAVEPSPSSDSAASDEGEWLDTRAQQAYNQMQQRLDQLQQGFTQSMAPVVQRQQDADYQQRLQLITDTSVAFKEKYGLNDTQMNAIENSIVQAQVLPALSQRHGSVADGMNEALEMFYWSNPEYRDQYVRQQAAAQAAETTQNDAATVRKQQLTALSASGGSAPRREPVPSTPEDRHAAMTAEIAAAMNGSGTIE